MNIGTRVGSARAYVRNASRRVLSFRINAFFDATTTTTTKPGLPNTSKSIMIIPITLPTPSSSSSTALLPPPLASLGSSELFLIELQGDLETSGDARGQTIGMLKIDEDGKVSVFMLSSCYPNPISDY